MTTKEFIQYAIEQKELCEELSTCNEPEKAFAIAQREGLSDDFETFKKVMAETKAEAEALGEADLETIQAAGTDTTTWVSATVLGSACSACTAVCAASVGSI